MEYVGKLGSLFTSVQSFYDNINTATLSGCVDILVVEQQDGELACSPFHVRFGKLSLLMPQEKKVEIKVNGQVVPYLMKVGEAGEAFFIFETEHEVPEEFQTSPIVGAVNESKTDEEPPFLDIGESKNQESTEDKQEDTKNQFEDDDTNSHMKLSLPAELQSPKMIIEEQMDKVVTNMDPYNHHYSQQEKEILHDDIDKLTLDSSPIVMDNSDYDVDKSVAPQNDVYPMDDGSTLLERVIPEAITTTTIAKETFIVRPANGDIYSKIMDVSHRSVQKRATDKDGQLTDITKPVQPPLTSISTSSASHQQEQKDQESREQHEHHEQEQKEGKDAEHAAHGHNESIVLDIAGYKTGEDRWDEPSAQQQDEVDNMILSKLEGEMTTHDIDRSMDLSETGNLTTRAESPEPIARNDLPQHSTTLGIDNRDEDENTVTGKEDQRPASTTPTATESEIITPIVTTTETTSTSSSGRLWGWGTARRKLTNESQNSTKNSNNIDNDTSHDDDDGDDDDMTSIGTDTTKATDVSQVVATDERSKTAYHNDIDAKDTVGSAVPLKYHLVPGTIYRIEMSLCGLSAFGSEEKENAKVFEEYQITYDTFMHNPNLLNDKRLVFRYEGRYYAAGHNGPLFTSLLLYKKPLQQATSEEDDTRRTSSADGSSGGNIEDSRESYLFGKGWRQWLSRSSMAAPPSSSSSTSKDDTLGSGKSKPSSIVTPATASVNGDATDNKSTVESEKERHEDVTTTFTTTTKTTTVGWNAEHNHSSSDGSVSDTAHIKPRKNYAKTLRLTSEQLKQLGLNKGVNTVSFSVTSAYQGTATCAAKIFFWDYDMPIVISDIDGTITKSDALGHVFTMIGKDWTHHGVAKLYSDISNNGYKILYLTSRAIGQSEATRNYLKGVEQGNYQLPDGPVIMSPDRLFTSFHREVIMRKPEVFKMACLKDIQRLFGGRDPFYAGFGNRITDAISYRSVNVPASRIFTIDPYGDIQLELLKGFTSSYIHLNDLVDQIFPPVNTKSATTDEEYNDWNFWKQPLPDIDLPADVTSTKSATPTSPKPKPIKPDLSSLPSETVVSSEKQQSSRGSLLRSLTAMSSSTTSSSSSLISDALPSRQQSPPPPPSLTLASSTAAITTTTAPSTLLSSSTTSVNTISPLSSSPPVVTSTSHIDATSGGRNRVHSFTATLRRPSLLLGTASAQPLPSMSASTPATVEQPAQIEKSDGRTDKTNGNAPEQGDGDVMSKQQQPDRRPESPTSTGLMNNLLSNGIDGVRNTLSRTFAYAQDGQIQQQQEPEVSSVSEKDTNTVSDVKVLSPTAPAGSKDNQKDIQQHEEEPLEEDDDDAFDASLDDLEHDMDDIPFI